MTVALQRFEGVAYRAVAGARPLWRQPNWHPGRFSAVPGSAHSWPAQYLCLHPMGPMAEFLRREPVAMDDPASVSLNVFALHVTTDAVLHVTFDNAAGLGIDPAALVADDWRPCQRWITALREQMPALAGVRTPSAALAGTDNLVLFGPRTPVAYGSAPRRSRFVPCAIAAHNAAAHEQLAGYVHPFRSRRPHAQLWAHRRHRPFVMVQPDPV